MLFKINIKNLTLLYKNINAILHCNSSYPSNPFELDLNVIPSLKAIYPDLKIGYSGHEIGYFPTTIAVAAGAEVVERHFTLDHTMEGTDQKASLEPKEFKEMVRIRGSHFNDIFSGRLRLRCNNYRWNSRRWNKYW